VALAVAMMAMPATARAADPAAAPSPNPAPSPAPRPVFSGLLQAWYVGSEAGTPDTLRIRRTELRVAGQVGTRVKWTIMIDPAKLLGVNRTSMTMEGQRVLADVSVNQAGRALQDAFISLGSKGGALQLDMGQLKLPMSLEGLQSSAALDTVERALFTSDRARGGTFGDIRDVGAVLRWMAGPRFEVHGGVYNGSGEGQNEMDRNDQKAIAGRVVVKPARVDGLQLGLSGVWAGGNGPGRSRRDRAGAELLFTRGRLKVRAEWTRGQDGLVERRGHYGLVSWKVAAKVELVGRVDTWDADVDTDADASTVQQRDYLAGVNYYLDGNRAKLQLDYVRNTFAGSVVRDRNLLLFNLQTSW
jgi:hypothetical protein